MRRLHVLYSFPIWLGYPGTGSTGWHQVRGLIDAGARVSVVCGILHEPIDGAEAIRQTMRLAGIRIPYRLLGQTGSLVRHDRLVAQMLPRMVGNVDLIHCWPLGSLKTLQAARSLGIPTVLERPNTHTRFAYDVVAREYERLGIPMPAEHSHTFDQARLSREEAEYAAADYLACPSDFVAETFLSRGVSSDRLIRHRYGCDLSVFRPATHSAEHKGLRALFVGSGEPRKGLHLALDAWFKSGAADRGGIFQICGKFIPEYEALLAEKLGHPSIRVAGFSNDVQALMSQSDVLILPSIEEGSALVTYEARACGCVLLVSNATGAVCKHNSNALVHRAGNVDELSQHLTLLLDQPQTLDRLRRASLAEASELSWTAAARRMIEEYSRVLGESQPASQNASLKSVPTPAFAS